MRNLKKSLALILALTMVLSIALVVPAGAKSSKKYDTDPQFVIASTGGLTISTSGAMTGNSDGYATIANDALSASPSTAPGYSSYTLNPSNKTYAAASVRVDETKAVVTVNANDLYAGSTQITTGGTIDVTFPLKSGALADAKLAYILSTPTLTITPPALLEVRSSTMGSGLVPYNYSVKSADLVIDHSYTLKVTMKANGVTNAPVIDVYSNTFTATTNDPDLSFSWTGANTANPNGYTDYDAAGGVTMDYTYELVNNTVTSDSAAGIAPTAVTGTYKYRAEKKTAAGYTVTANSVPATMTPPTAMDMTFTLSGYNSTTMKGLKAVIYSGSNTAVAVLSNTGNDTNAKFSWDGKFTLGADALIGTYVPAGNYTVKLLSAYTDESSQAKMIETGSLTADGIPFKVNEAPATIYTVKPSVESFVAKTGSVKFTVTANKANLKFYVFIKDAEGKVVYTMDGTTDTRFSGETQPWNGVLTVLPETLIPDGAYTVEAGISAEDASKASNVVIVGTKKPITSLIATEEPFKVGAYGGTAEITFNVLPADASITKVDKATVTIPSGNAKNLTGVFVDGKIMVTGLEKTENAVDVTVNVTFVDGTSKSFVAKVSVVDQAKEFKLENTILRHEAGYTGSDNKIKWSYSPEGSTGAKPTFKYVAKAEGATEYHDLEGDELAAAQQIATVDANGTVSFLMPGRVVFAVTAMGTTEYFIVCTTTENISVLVFYPKEVSELNVKANDLAADPTKQSRVSAYARPVYVADDEVIFSTSDSTTVALVYGDLASGTVSNKASNIPAGGHAGAFVGLKAGTATITATSKAKNLEGNPETASIVVNVAN